MNITIIGGGNIGTQFAVHCAAKGNRVTMFTSKPDRFRELLEIVDENDHTVLSGTLTGKTNKPQECICDADLIFVTVPAFLMKTVAEDIEQYIQPGTIICLVPGTGGGECCFHGCINKGCTIVGMQRVPSVARLVEYGKKVRATGYRSDLFLAAIPSADAARCADLIETILEIRCHVLPNYLNVTMTPSNPILHTTRLYSLFKDYQSGRKYESIPLFYEEWDDESSKNLFLCDEELQKVCKSIKEIDLSGVRSLKEHYESDTPEKLTKKIRSIKGFKGLNTPSIRHNDFFVPDFSSRYFTADFPYGLAILCDIAKLAEVDVPNMKKILEWYYAVTSDKKRFSYADYGIDSYMNFVRFYIN